MFYCQVFIKLAMYLYIWDSLYVLLSGVHKAWVESDLENQQESGKQEYFDRKLVFSTGTFILSYQVTISEVTISKVAISQGAISQGAISQGSISQGAISQGSISQGEISQVTIPKRQLLKCVVFHVATWDGSFSL